MFIPESTHTITNLDNDVYVPVSACTCRWYAHLLCQLVFHLAVILHVVCYIEPYFVPSAARFLSSCIRCTCVNISSRISCFFVVFFCSYIGVFFNWPSVYPFSEIFQYLQFPAGLQQTLYMCAHSIDKCYAGECNAPPV